MSASRDTSGCQLEEASLVVAETKVEARLEEEEMEDDEVCCHC